MSDKEQIDILVTKFFGIFNNKVQQPDWNILSALCIPEAIIIKKTGLIQQVFNLDTFMQPRKELLSSGTLLQFEEAETGESTNILDNMAQRSSTYQKSGYLNGESFQGQGSKLFQFIKTADGWKITALVWEDN